MLPLSGMLAPDIPEEFTGLVVSQPLAELPVKNAKQVRNTVELHLGSRGLEVLWGFDVRHTGW